MVNLGSSEMAITGGSLGRMSSSYKYTVWIWSFRSWSIATRSTAVRIIIVGCCFRVAQLGSQATDGSLGNLVRRLWVTITGAWWFRCHCYANGFRRACACGSRFVTVDRLVEWWWSAWDFGPNVVIRSGSCDCEALMVCAQRASDIDALSGRRFFSMMVGFLRRCYWWDLWEVWSWRCRIKSGLALRRHCWRSTGWLRIKGCDVVGGKIRSEMKTRLLTERLSCCRNGDDEDDRWLWLKMMQKYGERDGSWQRSYWWFFFFCCCVKKVERVKKGVGRRRSSFVEAGSWLMGVADYGGL